jgi:hypothetical protein
MDRNATDLASHVRPIDRHLSAQIVSFTEDVLHDSGLALTIAIEINVVLRVKQACARAVVHCFESNEQLNQGSIVTLYCTGRDTQWVLIHDTLIPGFQWDLEANRHKHTLRVAELLP